MFKFFKKPPDEFMLEIHIGPIEVIGLIKDLDGAIHEDFRLRRNDPSLSDPLLIFKIDELLTKIKMLGYKFSQANVYIFFPSSFFARDHFEPIGLADKEEELKNKLCAQIKSKKEDLLFNSTQNNNGEILLSAMPRALAAKLISLFKNQGIGLLSIKPDNPAIREFGE